MLDLFINNEKADTWKQTRIQLNKFILDLADVSKRGPLFTNVISLPPTAKNKRLLGHADTKENWAGDLYRFEVQERGTPVVSGEASIKSMPGDGSFKVQCVGELDIIGLLGSQKLGDLDVPDLPLYTNSLGLYKDYDEDAVWVYAPTKNTFNEDVSTKNFSGGNVYTHRPSLSVWGLLWDACGQLGLALSEGGFDIQNLAIPMYTSGFFISDYIVRFNGDFRALLSNGKILLYETASTDNLIKVDIGVHTTHNIFPVLYGSTDLGEDPDIWGGLGLVDIAASFHIKGEVTSAAASQIIAFYYETDYSGVEMPERKTDLTDAFFAERLKRAADDRPRPIRYEKTTIDLVPGTNQVDVDLPQMEATKTIFKTIEFYVETQKMRIRGYLLGNEILDPVGVPIKTKTSYVTAIYNKDEDAGFAGDYKGEDLVSDQIVGNYWVHSREGGKVVGGFVYQKRLVRVHKVHKGCTKHIVLHGDFDQNFTDLDFKTVIKESDLLSKRPPSRVYAKNEKPFDVSGYTALYKQSAPDMTISQLITKLEQLWCAKFIVDNNTKEAKFVPLIEIISRKNGVPILADAQVTSRDVSAAQKNQAATGGQNDCISGGGFEVSGRLLGSIKIYDVKNVSREDAGLCFVKMMGASVPIESGAVVKKRYDAIYDTMDTDVVHTIKARLSPLETKAISDGFLFWLESTKRYYLALEIRGYDGSGETTIKAIGYG